MISFLRLLFKFVETNLSDACLWSKFLFPYSLRLSFSRPFHVISTTKKLYSIFCTSNKYLCVQHIPRALLSWLRTWRMLCYVWQAKHNVTWKICRKKDRKKWDAGAKFIRFDLIYVRFTTTSGAWPKAKYQQHYQTVQQLVDFSQTKWKKVKTVEIFLEYRMLCYETVIQYLGTKEN